MSGLTHISDSGAPEMVDVSEKVLQLSKCAHQLSPSEQATTARSACAQTVIQLPENIAALLRVSLTWLWVTAAELRCKDPRELHMKKGPVLATAIIAGIHTLY